MIYLGSYTTMMCEKREGGVTTLPNRTVPALLRLPVRRAVLFLVPPRNGSQRYGPAAGYLLSAPFSPSPSSL